MEKKRKADISTENIYLFKINNKNTRKMCEICSKLTIRHKYEVNDNVLFSLSNFIKCRSAAQKTDVGFHFALHKNPFLHFHFILLPQKWLHILKKTWTTSVKKFPRNSGESLSASGVLHQKRA